MLCESGKWMLGSRLAGKLFKTAINGYGQKPVVANVVVKGRDSDRAVFRYGHCDPGTSEPESSARRISDGRSALWPQSFC